MIRAMVIAAVVVMVGCLADEGPVQVHVVHGNRTTISHALEAAEGWNRACGRTVIEIANSGVPIKLVPESEFSWYRNSPKNIGMTIYPGTVNSKVFILDTVDEDMLMHVMQHEMGHVIMGREHVTDRPSIMNQVISNLAPTPEDCTL